MRLLTCFCLLLLSHIAFAQQQITVHQDFKWKAGIKSFARADGSSTNFLQFEGAQYRTNSPLPLFSRQVAISNGSKLNVTLKNQVFVPITADIYSTEAIQNQVQVAATVTYQRKKPYAEIAFVPLQRNSTGQLQQLVSCDIEITTLGATIEGKKSKKATAANSVLASGKWFKIAVSQDGVYRLDRNFLQNLGMDIGNVDPRNIRIYGNGGGPVPEANATYYPDDLYENAIVVQGETDGSFDASDGVLFYGQGPDATAYNGVLNTLYHVKNVYSRRSYYYITADLGPGKRMGNQNNTSLTANNFSSQFDAFIFRDTDRVNLLSSGRQWFDDEMNFTPTQTYNLSFPNVVSSTPAKLKVVAAGSYYQASTMDILVDGQKVGTPLSFNGVVLDYDRPIASVQTMSTNFTLSSATPTLTLSYNKLSSSDAKAWLDYFEITVRRGLALGNNQMIFQDLSSIGSGKTTEFSMSYNNNPYVWDITNPLEPEWVQGTASGNVFKFKTVTDTLKRFIALESGTYLTAEAVGAVANQNLHALKNDYPEMLVVAPNIFLSQAEALGNFHAAADGYRVAVVSAEKVFNEFGSGKPDIGAIRNFTKMFYDNAGSDSSKMPRFLLLFGDGSYDNRNIIKSNEAFIPTYESNSSVDPTSSYVSDDFYGMLDDNEGANIGGNDKLDIAIGRIPVKNVNEANGAVEKIKTYKSTSSLGPWRNSFTFIADDEDNNLHIEQSDGYTKYLSKYFPAYNLDKIYLDAYQQESSPGGSRYPGVNEAINRKINAGTMVMNYTGHGGESGWAHERVLTSDDVEQWTNLTKLPLFITATCQFSRYDNPRLNTVGERLIQKTDGGAIALMTTVRLVYANENEAMNSAIWQHFFELHPNGSHLTLGEVIQRAKNTISGTENNRKFTLLGDPALILNYPKYLIKTTTYNQHNSGSVNDTMKALQRVTIGGEVTDLQGNILTSFNGILYPTIYDKASKVTTIANDPIPQFKNGSSPYTFLLQKNIIYRGKASVTGGKFNFSFVVPKDINYNFGQGKVSYYADDGSSIDAAGYDSTITVGGTNPNAGSDVSGPQIKMYMNDLKFVNGGTTNPSPVLLLKLSDANGINTVGNGIGHDIMATLDNDQINAQSLNDFYEAELDNYQKGTVSYPYNKLSVGKHAVRVKAWDVYNNSSEGYLEFIVADNAQLALTHVLNYPNPFTTHTDFYFEHNRPGQPLEVRIEIFTITGQRIKTFQQSMITEGFRSEPISWNGLDDFGDAIGKGVYVYKVSVKAPGEKAMNAYEKLVLLR